ncbi:MAG: tRNA (adenosine(37)-N6)-threonylcarbamoyltransferase complex dimerization subunit type 1 TsaB, partial [Bacteroidetes bacterium]|nr:tRNA (adenosine(37)-N6)-threonylcarbamoyltransferase complex dimerization subunit type 1 TsaB [Bacteroidota bacterium]
MEILHIECATFESSVALAKNGELIEQINLPDIGTSHSATLPLAIDGLLQKHSNFKPKAIAVSKGPGSYTGLRIGTSIAKGLCLGFNVPLIGIDTLEIIANGMVKSNGNFEFYHAMLKARNTEVYSAKFSSELSRISDTEPLQLDPLPENIELGKVCFGGN